ARLYLSISPDSSRIRLDPTLRPTELKQLPEFTPLCPIEIARFVQEFLGPGLLLRREAIFGAERVELRTDLSESTIRIALPFQPVGGRSVAARRQMRLSPLSSADEDGILLAVAFDDVLLATLYGVVKKFG